MTLERFYHRYIKWGIVLAMAGLLFYFLAPDTFAQLAIPREDVVNELTGSGIEINRSFAQTLLAMVNFFTGLLGFLATVIFIYAGVLWVLNMGNEDMITKAKKIMTYAAGGLVVVMLSFTIVQFITSSAGETCTDDSQCSNGYECVVTPDAAEGEAGVCQRKKFCAADADCPTGFTCNLENPDEGVCQSEFFQEGIGGRCRSDADCGNPTRYLCNDAGFCRSRCDASDSANPNKDCPAGFVCNAETSICESGLSLDGPPGGRCSETNPCREGYACTDAGFCRQSCSTPVDCPAGYDCLKEDGAESGLCGIDIFFGGPGGRCDSEHPCSPGYACDDASGFCRSECGLDTDCPAGYVCAGAADSTPGTCKVPVTGARCDTTEDCAGTAICDTETSLCFEPCNVRSEDPNAACPVGFVCNTKNRCQVPDSSFESLRCDTGDRRNPNKDCPSGFTCNPETSRCQAPDSAGGDSVAASEKNLQAIDETLADLAGDLESANAALKALPDDAQKKIQDVFREGFINDKIALLQDMLKTTDDPEFASVLEQWINTLNRFVLLRDEMDNLKLVMPESTDILQLWNEASAGLNDLIDDPDSSIHLRRFESKYRELRDAIRRFPVVEARIRALPGEGNVPFTVTLDALDSLDPTGGTISDYKWTFLDNAGREVSLGNSPVIVHEFTEPNTYSVRLQVSTSQRDENGYKTAADGIATVRVKAKPPTSQVAFRINGAEASDVHHLTIREADSGVVFDPSLTVPAMGRQIREYEWFFGDTTSELRSTPTSVVHTYAQPGEYFVKLRVTDSVGQQDARVVKLFIKSLAADIEVSPDGGDVNTEFHFRGVESRSDVGQIKHYQWNVEDEAGHVVKSSRDQAFAHNFDRPGEYKVLLTVTDVTGAQDNAVETFEVFSRPPVASFLNTVPETNHPNRMEFDAGNSYDPDAGDTITHSWDFDGDGTFDVIDSPDARVTYEYKRTGNYQVRLQVQDSFGQRDIVERAVPVESVLSADIVTSRRAVQVDQEMAFSVSSSNAVAYLWEFGDGETLNTQETTVSHTYSRKGRYSVKLHFFGAGDEEGIDTLDLLVGSSDSPLAIIGFLVGGRETRVTDNLCGSGKSGITVSRFDSLMFSGAQSINTDGSGRLLLYDWHFSDGTTNSKKEFTHRFNAVSESGCFEVSLAVHDQLSGQASDPDTVYIKVINEPPTITDFVIDAGLERELATPAVVTLRAVNPKDPDGTIKRYRWWYYKDGDAEHPLGLHSTGNPYTEMVITAAGEPGIQNRYFFVLEITDNDGGVYTTAERFGDVSYLDIENGPNLSPVAQFTVDKTTVSAGDSITFVSTAYDPQGDPLPDSAFAWDFDGDGQFDDSTGGAQVNRRYNTPGEFKARLKVTYRGLSSSAAQTVFVEPTQSLPQAAFTYTVDANTVTFDSGTSRFDPDLPDTTLRFEWDFNIEDDADGNAIRDDDVQSTEARPSFEYPASGLYRVRLKVKDMTGAEGIVVREVDLNLSQEERLRNSYKSLRISSPDQPLASLHAVATPSRVRRGGTADIAVTVLNPDNSDYFGDVYFEVIEGSGTFMPNPAAAKHSAASAIFTATEPGLVRIRVKAAGTTFGDLAEEVRINVIP